MAELSSCKSDYVTPKAENIYYFALYRKKNVLTSALYYQSTQKGWQM